MTELILAAAAALSVCLSLAVLRPSQTRRAGKRAMARLYESAPSASGPPHRRWRRHGFSRWKLPSPPPVRLGIALLVAGAGGAVWGWAVFGAPPLALICGLAAGIGARQVMARRMPSGRQPASAFWTRRVPSGREQLPEALSLQTCALRAGHSMIGSLQVIASELGPPLGEEVALVMREVELGASIDRALEDFALRMHGRELRLWVTAMLVHRQTGGDLARLLDATAERLRQADQLHRELRALSAQGRLSGLVMALAPLAFLALVSVTAREQVRPILSTLPGVLMLLTGLILDLAGFLWIRRILRIRI